MRGMYKSVIDLQLGGSAWRGKGGVGGSAWRGKGGKGGEGVEWAVEGHVVGWWVDSKLVTYLVLHTSKKRNTKIERHKKVREGGWGRRERKILIPPPQESWGRRERKILIPPPQGVGGGRNLPRE